MTENTAGAQTVHRWYTRPVFFVADPTHVANPRGSSGGEFGITKRPPNVRRSRRPICELRSAARCALHWLGRS